MSNRMCKQRRLNEICQKWKESFRLNEVTVCPDPIESDERDSGPQGDKW